MAQKGEYVLLTTSANPTVQVWDGYEAVSAGMVVKVVAAAMPERRREPGRGKAKRGAECDGLPTSVTATRPCQILPVSLQLCSQLQCLVYGDAPSLGVVYSMLSRQPIGECEGWSFTVWPFNRKASIRRTPLPRRCPTRLLPAVRRIHHRQRRSWSLVTCHGRMMQSCRNTACWRPLTWSPASPSSWGSLNDGRSPASGFPWG